MVVRFVDMGGIVYRHCFLFVFLFSLCCYFCLFCIGVLYQTLLFIIFNLSTITYKNTISAWKWCVCHHYTRCT